MLWRGPSKETVAARARNSVPVDFTGPVNEADFWTPLARVNLNLEWRRAKAFDAVGSCIKAGGRGD